MKMIAKKAQEEAALSSKLLVEMELCFVESDVQAFVFVELFNTSNSRIVNILQVRFHILERR